MPISITIACNSMADAIAEAALIGDRSAALMPLPGVTAEVDTAFEQIGAVMRASGFQIAGPLGLGEYILESFAELRELRKVLADTETLAALDAEELRATKAELERHVQMIANIAEAVSFQPGDRSLVEHIHALMQGMKDWTATAPAVEFPPGSRVYARLNDGSIEPATVLTNNGIDAEVELDGGLVILCEKSRLYFLITEPRPAGSPNGEPKRRRRGKAEIEVEKAETEALVKKAETAFTESQANPQLVTLNTLQAAKERVLAGEYLVGDGVSLFGGVEAQSIEQCHHVAVRYLGIDAETATDFLKDRPRNDEGHVGTEAFASMIATYHRPAERHTGVAPLQVDVRPNPSAPTELRDAQAAIGAWEQLPPADLEIGSRVTALMGNGTLQEGTVMAIVAPDRTEILFSVGNMVVFNNKLQGVESVAIENAAPIESDILALTAEHEFADEPLADEPSEPSEGDRLVNQAEKDEVKAAFEGLGISMGSAKELMLQRFGAKFSSDLTVSQARELIDVEFPKHVAEMAAAKAAALAVEEEIPF
jgi:hypothetical protein